MSEILTKELAEQFLRDPKGVDLSEFTSIEDSAAEVVSKIERGSLILDNISEISDSTAEFLSQYKGRRTAGAGGYAGGNELSLGLTELSDKQAKFLSEIQGIKFGGVVHEISLYLDKLTNLSDSAAESLSKLNADLSMEGLSRLSDSAAKSLSNVQGELSLRGLQELSDSAAKSISKHQGTIWLDGIRKLSVSAAKSLAEHQGSIVLRGLKTLTDAAAESLSMHKGPQFTLGISKVSDGFAASFSNYQGNLHFWEGVNSISYKAAESLSKCNKINGQNPKEWAKAQVEDIPHDEKLSIMRQKAIDLGFANDGNVDSTISSMAVEVFQQLRGILRGVKRKDFECSN